MFFVGMCLEDNGCSYFCAIESDHLVLIVEGHVISLSAKL